MLGVLAIASMLAPAVAQYVNPFSLRNPDVYFNLSIPTVSPFFTYRGNWSDGGAPGPVTLGPSSNMSFYGSGTAAWVYTRRGAGSASRGPPGAMLSYPGRTNGTNAGGDAWVFDFRTKQMAFTFALVDSVPAGDSLVLDSVTIETGMYTEAGSWADVHCVTEPFTRNASLPFSFQGGAWSHDTETPRTWGGAVIAPLPQNTSYVWVNASAVSGSNMNANSLNVFMTRGTTPLNFHQITLNSLRSYTAKDVIVYQAPLDPTDQYTLTLSAPANNLMMLNSITYCSYYKDGKVPAAAKKSNAGLIGGVVGGVVGGLLLLGLVVFIILRRRRRRQRSASPDAFVVDESAAVQPVPDKRMLGSMAVPRSSSPTQLAESSDLDAEYEAKLHSLANGGSRASRTLSGDTRHTTADGTVSGDSYGAGRGMSGDRTISTDSYLSVGQGRGMSGDSSVSASTERQKSQDGDGRPRRPRRPRRTRHIVEHAEDAGEVHDEHEREEEVVVEVLPPQYRPEWEQRRRPTVEGEQQQQQQQQQP
ncbi:hypothetical protein CC85DRAFT_304529 [Cutaneotrichosporon oleaginosum]|uniref:Uncharacterized protein n=1 Tax=Cutaneotrichosporon oleaginosum TaxID=879819 RepID=A0A0J0XG66_9TREE|nr:uncharacterized protein CC85DRAFT_304529 [Cutaneotrichosporon oleaginosum]KLT40041.1 hypothetical protein CC85DRAFT_304529 [Cutaneotrichosporon oleaginosum]TXT13816.1 hypothetical protein COLE_00009 [Cutaneotrichosporon oleaginosum]